MFVSEGAKVLIGDVRDAEGTEFCGELGKNSRYVNLNVTKTEDWEMEITHIALKRVGEMQDVAYAVLFLASGESAFVTRTELIVDGGEMAGNAAWGES
ncbi:MAG: SDR family oxidoreductase [Candidatus Azobacteroides sp.]|nr:SDR family oxidoreductase [Candidatus Azobacteroides sp.]